MRYKSETRKTLYMIKWDAVGATEILMENEPGWAGHKKEMQRVIVLSRTDVSTTDPNST